MLTPDRTGREAVTPKRGISPVLAAVPGHGPARCVVPGELYASASKLALPVLRVFRVVCRPDGAAALVVADGTAAHPGRDARNVRYAAAESCAGRCGPGTRHARDGQLENRQGHSAVNNTPGHRAPGYEAGVLEAAAGLPKPACRPRSRASRAWLPWPPSPGRRPPFPGPWPVLDPRPGPDPPAAGSS